MGFPAGNRKMGAGAGEPPEQAEHMITGWLVVWYPPSARQMFGAGINRGVIGLATACVCY